jgi:hypothetical protein
VLFLPLLVLSPLLFGRLTFFAAVGVITNSYFFIGQACVPLNTNKGRKTIYLFIWACPTPPAGGSGQAITSIFYNLR